MIVFVLSSRRMMRVYRVGLIGLARRRKPVLTVDCSVIGEMGNRCVALDFVFATTRVIGARYGDAVGGRNCENYKRGQIMFTTIKLQKYGANNWYDVVAEEKRVEEVTLMSILSHLFIPVRIIYRIREISIFYYSFQRDSCIKINLLLG